VHFSWAEVLIEWAKMCLAIYFYRWIRWLCDDATTGLWCRRFLLMALAGWLAGWLAGRMEMMWLALDCGIPGCLVVGVRRMA